MVPVIPTLPTDNLYKFLALFGLVLVVFGVFFPEEKLARSLAAQRDADKARRVAKIRIDRKNAELRDPLKQIKDRLTELSRNSQQLKDAETMFETKAESLTEQAKQRNLKLKDAKELYAQTKALNPELQALASIYGRCKKEYRKPSEFTTA